MDPQRIGNIPGHPDPDEIVGRLKTNPFKVVGRIGIRRLCAIIIVESRPPVLENAERVKTWGS